ncbi:hypothetical protein Hokovirus_2_213 [Hokovirus HKV1]|uniref:Uncharacterized protein n=1 Tax=Hokovirus HKV1 TaxID=1977638 RepID=A0A1V0SG29_9VIRU|nr:hypothetical protein Hokovirus_2_213 [Hokovirus HKV1]
MSSTISNNHRIRIKPGDKSPIKKHNEHNKHNHNKHHKHNKHHNNHKHHSNKYNKHHKYHEHKHHDHKYHNETTSQENTDCNKCDTTNTTCNTTNTTCNTTNTTCNTTNTTCNTLSNTLTTLCNTTTKTTEYDTSSYPSSIIAKRHKSEYKNKKHHHSHRHASENGKSLCLNKLQIKFSNISYNKKKTIMCSAIKYKKYIHIWSSINVNNLIVKNMSGNIRIKTLHHCENKIISGNITIFNKDTNTSYSGIIYKDPEYEKSCLLCYNFSNRPLMQLYNKMDGILQFNIYIQE